MQAITTQTARTTIRRIALLGSGLLLAVAVACGGSAEAQHDPSAPGHDGAIERNVNNDGSVERNIIDRDGSHDNAGNPSDGTSNGNGNSSSSSSDRNEVESKPVDETTRREVRDTLGDELESAGLRLPDDVVVRDLGGRVYEVRGDLTLHTAAGDIPVLEAVLTVDLSHDGVVTWRGTSELPFPTFGPFQYAVVQHTSRAEVGYDYGRNLTDLGAHLNDDRLYAFFRFEDGLSVDTGFDRLFGESASLPVEITVPGGVSAVMALDPTDPYLYIGSACPTFPGEKQDGDADGNQRRNDDDRNDDNNNRGNDNQDDDNEAVVEVAPKSEGEDCGLGFSLNGYIPFEPVDANWLREGGAPFSGHLVMDAVVPLYKVIEVDGTVVTGFDTTSYRQGGNGDVSVTVPFVDGLIDFSIPLGNASAGVNVDATPGSEQVYAFFSGTYRSPDGSSFLPAEIARLIPMQTAEIRVAGQFGMREQADGSWRVDGDSFLRATGEMGFQPGFLGDLTGLDLSELLVQQSELRIDRDGFLLTGTTTSSLHPALGFEGGTQVTAYVSAANLADSYLELRGNLTVSGVKLDAGAVVRLDAQGLHVDGHFVTAVSRIELSGEITAQGVALDGLTRVEFPLNVLQGVARDAEAGLDQAIAEVKRLDDDIAAMRKQVLDERRAASGDFQVAQAALRKAQANVDKIQHDIDYNKAQIAKRQREIRSWQRWYDNSSALQKSYRWAKLGTEVGWREAEITSRYTAIGTLEGSRVVAKGVLVAAEETLKGIDQTLQAIPVDASPRVASLIAARETAVATLEGLRSVSQVAQTGGTLAAQIDVHVDNTGISGTARGEHCGSNGCTTLLGGSVAFQPTPEVCLAIFGTEACAGF